MFVLGTYAGKNEEMAKVPSVKAHQGFRFQVF